MSAYNMGGNAVATSGAFVDIASIKNRYPTYTDDQILDVAISEAKSIGSSAVIVWDGKAIRFSGQVTHECKGFGGIDFNGSKIYMPDYDGGEILSVVPDSAEDIVVSASSIKSYYTTSNDLKGKIFKINQTKNGNADMCLGYRYSDSSEATLYSSPLVVASLDGIYESGDLYLTPETGMVNCYNVHEYPSNRFEISNGIVVSNASANMSILVMCMRSNTHVHNFKLEGQSATTAFHWGIFVFLACYDIEVSHISGKSPIMSALTSGYTLGFRSVTNLHVHDINIGDSTSWGAVGGRSNTNTVFERCYLNRWDCHFVQFGYNVIRDCVLNNVLYGLGNGSITIEDCIFVKTKESEFNPSVIFMREDCPGVYDGTITVRRCKFHEGVQSVSGLVIWWDGCKHPKPSNSRVSGSPKQKRIIDNCQFPDGFKGIIQTGTETSADMPMFAELSYDISNCYISCNDSVISGAASGQSVKSVSIDGCRISNGSTVKTLTCDLNVSNSYLVTISSNVSLPSVIATGNKFFGTQTVSGFAKYAFSGNVASDMASVNKHS